MHGMHVRVWRVSADREVYYEVVATYIVPQFKDGAFVEDTWPTTTPSG
jgi:hypothetical protein